ncbi:hypothetical protein IAT38_001942 [Cryptococcus sp. DSM 104549]
MLKAVALTALFSAIQLLEVGATVYPLTESLAGTSFFDGWQFPTEKYDNTTNGDVFWATASNTSLLYVNDAGRIVLKVDNTTLVPYNDKRYAPKLLSKNQYEIGTVWVMDAVHMPYGCSVWPGFWTQGPNWPAGGEIDISEGINMRTTNMIALHTDGTVGTCTVSGGTSMTGQVTVDNCDNKQSSGSGCTVNDTNSNSYGEGFAAAGGGVYVAEFAKDAIRVWFLSRPDVPSDVTVSAESIDTSTLGTPVAEYSSDTCDIENLFGPQSLTLDITLCGDFAGISSLLAETCPALEGDNTCYTTYVINDASATYAQAYYEINYINVYSANSTATAGSNTTAPNGAASASTTVTAGVTGTSASGAASSGNTSGAGVGWRMEVCTRGAMMGVVVGLGTLLWL